MTYLDQYCERSGDAALWAEPLNAVTNLAFIVAAILVARALLQQPGTKKSIDLWLLTAALFCIGIGNGLWHLFATSATMMADVIPIGLFIHLYLISALRRLFHRSWLQTFLWWFGYFAISIAAQKVLPPDMLHGTVMYLPTFGAMAVMTAVLYRRRAPAARPFALVIAVWAISLTFRTIDLEVCDQFPIGTHFLWHVLNAWVLWRLLMVLVTSRRHP